LSTNNLTVQVEEKIYLAFQKIHKLGVVHHDVRSDNVLVSTVATGESSVWMIDFQRASTGNDFSYEFEHDVMKDVIERVKRGDVEW
jgi:RIO-like serine/threonine protein kinase